MTSQACQSTDLLQNENECKVCKGEVGNKEKALSCDICMRWVHIDCGKITQASYGALKKINSAYQGIKWL